MLNDVRQAIRLLVRTRGFTAIACLTLALGTGANTAIFSVADAALFRPLPYRDADRLASVHRVARTSDGREETLPIWGNRVDAIRDAGHLFDRVEVFSGPRPRVLAGELNQSPLISGFSVGLPSLLGIAPQIGRTFTADDLASRDTIVLSDAYWRRAFAGTRDAIGRVMTLTDRQYRVIGVMPASFRYFAGASTDGWIVIGDREGEDLVAYLRPGVTIAQAQRQLREVPVPSTGTPVEWMLEWRVEPAGSNRVQGPPRVMLLSLMGAVGFVLLIACGNVANLILARTLSRQREIAVRGALGATRLQLVRQFVIEGVLLGAVAGVAAILVSWLVIRAIPAMVPDRFGQTMFAAALPTLDWRVVLFGFACALIAGGCCGLMPAIRASRTDSFAREVAAGGRTVGPTRAERRLRDAFQALQIALTLVLLAGAGLLVGSFIRLVTLPSGFEADRLLYLQMANPPNGWTPERQAAYAEEVIRRISRAPGVRAVSAGQPPVATATFTGSFTTVDAAARTIERLTSWYVVGDGYFRTAGIPLLAGRSFGTQDRPDSQRVAVISDNLANRLWPGQSALGQRVLFSDWHPGHTYQVVGVVPHLKTLFVVEDGVEVFVSTSQKTPLNPSFIVRADGGVAQVGHAIRAELRGLDSAATLARFGTIAGLHDEHDPLGPPRLHATLVATLAGLGLFTAAIGLYGVVSYSVGRRTREIGLRMALGAEASRIRTLVIREALVPIAAGVFVGLLGAFWLSRLLAAQLFRLSPHDPGTFVGIVFVLLVACAVAAGVPVRRATRIDPVHALRAD